MSLLAVSDLALAVAVGTYLNCFIGSVLMFEDIVAAVEVPGIVVGMSFIESVNFCFC